MENNKGNDFKAGIILTIGVIILAYQGGRMNRKRQMDATQAILQGGDIQTTGRADNVKNFPSEARELSNWEVFLMKAGAKELANPKTTSPLEWNKSVLGLAATILTLVLVLVGGVWNYATLSTNFNNEQRERLRLEKEIGEVKTRMAEIERRQYQSDLMNERINGFKAGVAESETKEKK